MSCGFGFALSVAEAGRFCLRVIRVEGVPPPGPPRRGRIGGIATAAGRPLIGAVRGSAAAPLGALARACMIPGDDPMGGDAR